MSEIPGEVNPPQRILLGPGPSQVHPRVLRAMSAGVVGHLDPEFLRIMDDVRRMLRQVFQTENEATFALSATGMAGMEACVVNLMEAGDRLAVCAAGFFGQRIAEVGRRAGAAVLAREKPVGQAFTLEEIEATLREARPKVLALVHAETSTGVCQPIARVGELCRKYETLLLLDCVTSLGCIPVELDAWGVDAAYSCSQKGLGCPPGLAPVSFSRRAVDAIRKRKSAVQSWYFDLTQLERYWGSERQYHHTAPISMMYALREGLRLVLEEGLAARFERHRRNHAALCAGLAVLDLKHLAEESIRLPQLNALLVPAGVDDAAVRRRMLSEFGIEIGGGLGELKGKLWRIGLMGHGCRPNHVLLCLAALEHCLKAAGRPVRLGEAVAAAQNVYLHQSGC